ncbi:MAG: S8 family serine peptidase [Gammaproteobacteria bacterium]|nr:S8 family serine peptidase [Gammaproteobacteria bacterium]
MIEDLVAEVAAHGRDGGTTAKVQAPPSRDLPPSPADSRPGEAQRRSPPDGYAYATFERAGIPTRSGDTGDEEAVSPQAPEWLSSPDSLAAVAANAEAAGRDWSFGWVRLGAGARLEDASAELDALGVVVEGQAGDLLRARLPGDPGRLRAVGALAAVDGLGAQPPSAKLPAAFAQEARVKPAHEIVPVFVTLAAADDGDGRWRAALERLGAVVGAYDAHTRSYTANVEYGGLDALAAADFVAFVEPVGIVEAANDTAVPAMGADAYRTYTDAVGWGGTAGQGVAVGVMDTGLNINHLDIETGRLSVCGANFVPSLEEEQDLWVDAGGHGTHVTATIAGSGAAERRYAGMAPLVPHIRFAKVLNLRGRGTDSWIFAGMNFLAEASSCGAAGWTDDAVAPPIVNMSLSAAALIFEGRDAAARKLDAVVWDTGQLYVVANANSDIHGFANYGAAKNSPPVGAAWDSGELASLSSHGPTADGRLVPLVVGTGVYVYSARGDGSRGAYVRYSGTSMSSPSVAGIAALVMDAQPDLVGNAALARAHLMASAVKPDAWLDAEDAFPPDNTNGPGVLHARYGLGKVSGSTSVFDRPGDDGWESAGWHGISLDTGEASEHVIDVPPDASRLDVVLTWDEPPADVIANTVLNDLDLRLERPFPRLDAVLGSRSRRDNVEWVIVRNPQSGRWRARVEAERIHGEKPRAALAYTIIRGPATPQLSIVAASDTLGPNGDVELTVSTDGYVAAGTRLVMDCRTAEGAPCHPNGNYQEVQDDAPAFRTVGPGDFVLLGEIRPDEPRTLRFRGLGADTDARMHFTVTGWNAKGDTAVVFAEEAEDVEFAAPANDDFVKAVDLEGPVEGDLLMATTESGEPAFEDGTERPAASVWYRWTAKDDGAVHFSLAPTEAFSYPPYPDRELYQAFETRVDVYQGNNIAGAQPVASAPWGASFLAERGSDYLVRVAGRARVVPFKLSFRQGGAPENDAFDAAVVLEGGEGQVEGTNAGATLEAGERFGPLAATVWYEWTVPDDGWYEFGSSAAHLKVLAFEDAASVGEVRLVSGFPEEDLRFPAKAGNVYRFAVASQDADAAGVEVERSVYVGRDEPVEPGEPEESGVRTEWWSWTAPATGEYTWRLGDPLRLTAFKGGTLDDLVTVGSNIGPTNEFFFAADQDDSYRFSVAAAPGWEYTGSGLSGTVVWGPTPSNDTWSSAAPIVAATGTARASNRFATIETGERSYDVGHSSLWWSFEAPEAGWYRFWIDEMSSPFTLAAYADDPVDLPGSLEMVASSERGAAVGIEVYVHAEDAGERFAIRVGTRGDDEGGEFTLNWEDSEPPVWLRYLGRTADRYEYVDDDGQTFAASLGKREKRTPNVG